MSSDFRAHFNELSPEEKERFFSSLDDYERDSFQDFFAGETHYHGFHQQMEQFNQWAMSESLKSVTPFDHGGYVMGAGFNPSDTMAHEAHQMHMDFGNSFSDFGSTHDSFNDSFSSSFHDSNSMNGF